MSEKLTKIVVDCTTGKQTILPLTAAEIAQRDQDAAAFAEAEEKRKTEADRISALKESARAKLASGDPLTEEEAAVIVI
jgi:16S rRNA C1402 N4-methylase RsmH